MDQKYHTDPNYRAGLHTKLAEVQRLKKEVYLGTHALKEYSDAVANIPVSLQAVADHINRELPPDVPYRATPSRVVSLASIIYDVPAIATDVNKGLAKAGLKSPESAFVDSILANSNESHIVPFIYKSRLSLGDQFYCIQDDHKEVLRMMTESFIQASKSEVWGGDFNFRQYTWMGLQTIGMGDQEFTSRFIDEMGRNYNPDVFRDEYVSDFVARVKRRFKNNWLTTPELVSRRMINDGVLHLPEYGRQLASIWASRVTRGKGSPSERLLNVLRERYEFTDDSPPDREYFSSGSASLARSELAEVIRLIARERRFIDKIPKV
jgi:hypothetical protein